MLALPNSVFLFITLVVCGRLLRNSGILSARDAQTAGEFAQALTLPAFIFQMLSRQDALLAPCFLSASAAVIHCVASVSITGLMFRKRHPRERALLCGLSVGSEMSSTTLAWLTVLWNVAGAEIGAIFACFNAISESVVSYLLMSSAGPGNPKAYKHADGGTYDGEWNGIEKQGMGVYRYTSGARYEGQWRKNAKHGTGVYHYPDGSKFEGEFANGERNGLGVRTWASGKVKAGHFLAGKLQRIVPLTECGTLLRNVLDSSAAARAVKTGGNRFIGALSQPGIYPPLLALLGALSVLNYNFAVPEWLDVTTAVLSGLHIPLALIAFGVLFTPVQQERREIPDVRAVIRVRVLTGLLLSIMLLIITPRHLPYTMRSIACTVCLLAPISWKALAHANFFKLNDSLCGMSLTTSLVLSNILIAVIAFVAWAYQLIPIGTYLGREAVSTVPVLNWCWYLFMICTVAFWAAPKLFPATQLVKMTLPATGLVLNRPVVDSQSPSASAPKKDDDGAEQSTKGSENRSAATGSSSDASIVPESKKPDAGTSGADDSRKDNGPGIAPAATRPGALHDILHNGGHAGVFVHGLAKPVARRPIVRRAIMPARFQLQHSPCKQMIPVKMCL